MLDLFTKLPVVVKLLVVVLLGFLGHMVIDMVLPGLMTPIIGTTVVTVVLGVLLKTHIFTK